MRPDKPHDIETVHVGHVEIEDDRVHFAHRKHFDRFQAGTGLREGRVHLSGERGHDHPSNRRRIIDNQNRRHIARSAAPCPYIVKTKIPSIPSRFPMEGWDADSAKDELGRERGAARRSNERGRRRRSRHR